MAVKSKTDITSEINSIIVGGGAITASDLNGILIDIVDSYEDLIQEYTTVQRDLLTPFEGLKIYNTTSNRLEYYSASQWMPCSQKEVVALDCSGNPNYSEALVGDQYIVSVAGYVGGASGKSVYVGDLVYCIEDNAGGNEATVGTKWQVCHSGGQQPAQMKSYSVTIPSAQVLTLNSIPFEISIAAAAKAIQIMGGNVKMNYGTTPYATHTNALIGQTTQMANPQFSFDIGASANIWNVLTPELPIGGGSVQIVMSDDISIITETGDPTAGDSDITITIFYLEV